SAHNNRDLHSFPTRRSSDLVEQFKNLVIKQQGGAVVRLSDVANVTLGAEDYDSEVGFDGKKPVYIGINVAPAANLLDVIAGVRRSEEHTSELQSLRHLVCRL